MDQPQPTSLPRRASSNRAVTMQDIALQCGVTKQTVSRALMGDTRISIATRERVQAVAEDLGYDPTRHHAARRMALRKHGLDAINQVVAVYFPPYTYRSNYMTELFWGIWEGLNQQGYALLGIEGRDPQTQSGPPPVPPAIKRGEADAAIVFSRPEDFASTLTELRQEEYFGDRPVVFLSSAAPGCSLVTADYYQGALASAQHLLALGHRRLLWTYHHRDRSTMPVRQRHDAYQQALQEAGLDPAQHLVELAWDDKDVKESLAQAMQMLQERPAITGVLARNDTDATLIARAAQRLGRRIPDDFSLVGFDDTDPLVDAGGHNILASVKLPLHEMGRQAAQLAIGQVTGQFREQTTMVLATEFIPRASTAPPRG